MSNPKKECPGLEAFVSFLYHDDDHLNDNLLSGVGGHVEAHESDASDEDARQDQVEH